MSKLNAPGSFDISWVSPKLLTLLLDARLSSSTRWSNSVASIDVPVSNEIPEPWVNVSSWILSVPVVPSVISPGSDTPAV